MAIEDWINQRIDNLGEAVDRRIDNEIAGDVLPSPGDMTNDKTVVKTGETPLDTPKVAGTGRQFVPGVDNRIALGIGGIALLGLFFWAVR